MRVVRELDAGPMLATVRHHVGDDETSVEVERALASLGAPLLLSVVERLAAGTAHEIPQDDARATYAPKIEDRGRGRLVAARRALQPRARLQPWPLVSAHLGNARFLIHRTSRTGARADQPGGTVVQAAGDELDVAAGARRSSSGLCRFSRPTAVRCPRSSSQAIPSTLVRSSRRDRSGPSRGL